MRFPFLLVLTLCLLLSPFAAADTTPPPEPEQYVDNGQYLQYVKAAQLFLHDNADSAAAPRVAMDLMVTATVLDDQPTALQMRKLMVISYPTSTQAKYVIGTSPDAATFAAFMGEIATEGFDSLTPSFASRYDLAMRLGIARFGPAGFGGGPSLVRTFILCGIAGDGQLEKAAVDVLNGSGARGELWRRILIILTDTTATPLAKLNYLHALPDRSAAAPFERYVLTQLSAADRATPAVTQIEADDLLDANRLADALPLLARLPAPAEPRILFWQAWASAATGDTAAAEKIFAQLRRDHPSDPWSTQAADLEQAIPMLDSGLGKNVEAALSAARRIKAGPDLLEFSADYTRSDGQKLNIYVGLDTGKLFELLIRREGATALAYRVTDQGGEFFFQGSTVTAHFAKPALLPAPRFQMARSGNEFLFRGDMHFVNTFDDLKSSLSDLVTSRYLDNREGLQDLLGSFIRRGIFPLAPQPGAGGATIYTWVTPAVSTPHVSRVAFTVSADSRITAVQTSDFAITNLRYGPAGSFTLNAPALPDLKLVERGTMDAAIMQQILPAAYSLFTPPPTTQPAVASPVPQPAKAPAK